MQIYSCEFCAWRIGVRHGVGCGRVEMENERRKWRVNTVIEDQRKWDTHHLKVSREIMGTWSLKVSSLSGKTFGAAVTFYNGRDSARVEDERLASAEYESSCSSDTDLWVLLLHLNCRERERERERELPDELIIHVKSLQIVGRSKKFAPLC